MNSQIPFTSKNVTFICLGYIKYHCSAINGICCTDRIYAYQINTSNAYMENI